MEDRECPRLFSIRIWSICQIVVEKINKERLYKSVRSTHRHQKQQIWGWIVISMKLESFRLTCKYRVLVFLEHWLPTLFMFTQSSLAKDLAAQSGSNCYLKLQLLWTVPWPLGFAYFSLHKFSRISARNALMFVVSDNPMYTTSSTTKFRSFTKFSSRKGS